MRISVIAAVVMIGWPIAAMAENPAPDADLFRTVAGTWGWKDHAPSSCQTNPHTIVFSEGNSKMLLKHSKSANTTTYRVLYAEKNQITMLVDGEQRRTELGDRVIWVLDLKDSNTYAWRRTDWKRDSRTGDIVRCK
ncbi:MAG: hypothetical protein HY244_03925 [Rhizobiales bacterium]|nr:hypothetical protein [Hyphomicrobiales bacterium]